jgi:hypothetical protein
MSSPVESEYRGSQWPAPACDLQLWKVRGGVRGLWLERAPKLGRVAYAGVRIV